ncbi:MAG TPA: hypothetical protein ENJ20_06155 [Bacteroidetes bacterium]|nr:hypothetical protein [Bacteroidota bacterium]
MKRIKNVAYLILFSIVFFWACKKDVDKEPPVIAISSPSEGAVVEGGLLQLNAVITDNTGLKSAEIRLISQPDGTTVFEKTEQLNGKQANILESIPLQVPDGGDFEVLLTAFDQSGNTTTEKRGFVAAATDRGTLDLVFRLHYDGQLLPTFEDITYPYPPFPFHISLISFFISNITITGNGTEEEILEIERIRLNENHDDPASAQQGTTLSITGINPGQYTGIRFGLGVPAGLNAKSPVDFPQGHPLFFSGEYWDSWDSYIFFKIEGKADTNNDGTKETNIALHAGSNDAFRVKEIPSVFSIEKQQTTTLEFIIEVKNIFENNGQVYDLIGTPQIHSLSQMDQAIELADNLAGAIQ